MDVGLLTKLRNHYAGQITCIQGRINFILSEPPTVADEAQLLELTTYRDELFEHLKEVNFLIRKVFNQKLKYD
jgi:hypothetical protein